MANNKTGFAYYNVDTDKYQDGRIKRLKKNFGATGIAIYDYILCEIYRVKGCFSMWDESTAFDVAEYFNLKETTVQEIVGYCCSVGLFNKELLASESILTSQSIQIRYTDMCLRAKRKTIIIPEKIRILQEGCEIILEESLKTPEGCDKVKKSKVKERKEEVFHPQDLSNSNLYRKPVIPTKQEVWECFIQNGGTKEMAKKFWETNEATGWYYKSSPITNFRNMVAGYVASWNKNQKNEVNTENAAIGRQISEKKGRELLDSIE